MSPVSQCFATPLDGNAASNTSSAWLDPEHTRKRLSRRKSVCHTAVVSSRQNVKVSQHYVLLTERSTSLKKAVCEASVWIPLWITFAPRASTAVMLAPFLAGRHSSTP